MKKQASKNERFTIGIISDTHGLLRPEAVDALQGVDLILHAGDIGKESVLDELQDIAPVVAVKGNMDSERWANKLKKTEVVEAGEMLICLLHDIGGLDIDPVKAHVKAVISGHSHRPSIQTHKNVLYINPGSAGPRRFTLPVSVALLHKLGKTLDAEIVRLK